MIFKAVIAIVNVTHATLMKLQSKQLAGFCILTVWARFLWARSRGLNAGQRGRRSCWWHELFLQQGKICLQQKASANPGSVTQVKEGDVTAKSPRRGSQSDGSWKPSASNGIPKSDICLWTRWSWPVRFNCPHLFPTGKCHL